MGEMSSLFGLLGADVVGIDINKETISIAREETQKHGVVEKVELLVYDGDLDFLPDGSFNLVFTKSVLVVVPDLPEFLTKIYAKLKPGGSAIFIENGYGNFALHALRRYRHKKWDYNSNAHFFRDTDRALFENIFDSVTTKKTFLPPPFICFTAKNLKMQNRNPYLTA